MIKEAIKKVVASQDLTFDEANAVMTEIMSGETTQTQNAAFLAALSAKNGDVDTIDEIAGCAVAMRSRALAVPHEYDVLEIVGTGGDGSHSFNISTTAAFVIAAFGVKVAKHGNRAASSKCGAADCLEALGARIELEPEECVRLLGDVGFCFFFAQKYHASMKYVGAIRKELGIRTVFNVLGPLTNPAKPSAQLLGVYSPALLEPMADALTHLGVKRGLVVYGQDKLDEISMSAPTSVCEFAGADRKLYEIAPEQFGLTRCTKEELVGGDPSENAAITRAVLNGEQGARRGAVILNAGAAIYAGGKVASIAEGVELAAKLIDNGSAAATLDRFVQETQQGEGTK